ncbi:MAG: hypothetical protein R3C28_25630 [Pirellulaceae bacterium]
MKSKSRRKKPSADLRPVRTRLRLAWTISLLAIAACLGGAYYLSVRPSIYSAENILPEPPINLEQLDPEVAALIHAKMDQVRQNVSAESLVDLGLVYEVNGLWNEAFDAFSLPVAWIRKILISNSIWPSLLTKWANSPWNGNCFSNWRRITPI